MPGYTIRVKASVEREIAALPRDVVATAPAALRNTWRALTDTPEGREKVIDLILRLPEFMKYEQCIHGSKTTAPPTTSALFGDRTGAGPCPGRAGTSPSSSYMDRLPAATSTRGAISSGISASGLTDGRQPSSVSPIEPLCYTEEEFAELVRSANPPGAG
jgi:hypothetical protein